MKITSGRIPGTHFIGMRTRLLLSVMLVLTVSMVALFIWFNHYISVKIWQHIREDALSSLAGALNGIDGDKFEALVQDMRANQDAWGLDGTRYPADERFWENANWLLTVHTIDQRMYLYTYVPGSAPNEVVFISSHGAPLNPPEGAYPFEFYQSEVLWKGLSALSETQPALETPDAYGIWALTVCAPIRNSHGESVGALGLDLKSDILQKIQDDVRKALIIMFFGMFFFMLIILYSVATGFVRPILRLTQAARRAGQGDYAQDLSGLMQTRVQDEIGTLAQVFDEMLDQLQEREARSNPSQSFKIEIDQQETARSLEIITQSAAFSNAAAAAQSARQEISEK